MGQLGVQHEQDEIYYMRARYYDAEIGRFLKEDPIAMAGGLNVSLYAGGNPVVNIDPSGLASDQVAISVALIVWNRGFTGSIGIVRADTNNDHVTDGYGLAITTSTSVSGLEASINFDYSSSSTDSFTGNASEISAGLNLAGTFSVPEGSTAYSPLDENLTISAGVGIGGHSAETQTTLYSIYGNPNGSQCGFR